jgi:hypothetical protein
VPEDIKVSYFASTMVPIAQLCVDRRAVPECVYSVSDQDFSHTCPGRSLAPMAVLMTTYSHNGCSVLPINPSHLHSS